MHLGSRQAGQAKVTRRCLRSTHGSQSARKSLRAQHCRHCNTSDVHVHIRQPWQPKRVPAAYGSSWHCRHIGFVPWIRLGRTGGSCQALPATMAARAHASCSEHGNACGHCSTTDVYLGCTSHPAKQAEAARRCQRPWQPARRPRQPERAQVFALSMSLKADEMCTLYHIRPDGRKLPGVAGDHASQRSAHSSQGARPLLRAWHCRHTDPVP